MSEQLTEISEIMQDIVEILKEYAAPQNWERDKCILGRQLAGIGLKRWRLSLSINPIFEAEKREGKIYIASHVKARMQRWLATIKDGTALELIVRPYKARVSSEQRAYYFGVVVPILCEFFGHDNKNDMHEDLKLYFNPVQSKIDPSVMVGGSTTGMSSDEFYGNENSFVKKIIRWAAMEHGVEIPDPGEAAAL